MNEDKGNNRENRERLPQPYVFQSSMSHVQTVIGWIYLPVHLLVLPLLLPLLTVYMPDRINLAQVNLLYYGIGIALCLTVMLTFLRRDFETLLDAKLRCLVALGAAFLVTYILNFITAAIIMAMGEESGTPNNDAVIGLAEEGYGTMKAVTVFLAPIVEEVLFRGVVFGSIRRRSRIAAYVCSIVLFSLYHVWQFAVAESDPSMLLYALEYIPISFALTLAYERSGSIWTSMAFHMLNNVIGFRVLEML